MSILYQKKRFRYILNLIESGGGYILETDREIKKCDCCFKDLNLFDFFFCRSENKVICRECILKSHIMPFEWEHIDWHIIKVESIRGAENEA